MISLPGTYRNRRIRTLLFSVLSVLGFALLQTVPAAAIDQGGIGGRPARPKESNIRSQSIFVHTVKPGEQAKDAIEVINNTTETKRILVYAVDSQVSSGGAFACAQAADQPISVGTWVGLNKKEVTLNAGAKQTVDFTVSVPKDTAPGEHNGCIVVQDTKQQAARDSNGIVLSLRSAIRLAVTVPGDIKKGLAFSGLASEPKGDDKMLLSAALKNSGNVSLDTQLDIRLVYPFGLSATKAGGNFPVLSSSEGRFNFEAPKPFWGGWYRLTAVAHYNDNLKNAIGEGSATASTARSKWIYVAPDPLAVVIEIIAVVVVGGGIFYLVRRKLHHKRTVKRATVHVVQPGEDLPSVAEQYGMAWKQLARINKLKPPYQLKAGRKLLVATPHPEPHVKPRKKPQPRS